MISFALLSDAEAAAIVRVLPDAVLAHHLRIGALTPDRGPANGVVARVADRGYGPILLEEAAREKVDPALVCARGRHPSAVAARHAVWRRLRDGGLSFPEIARLFGVDHTSVLYACSDEKRKGRNARRRLAKCAAAEPARRTGS